MTKTIAFISILMFCNPVLFAAGEAPHWDYDGDEGPNQWGQLADEFSLCSDGKNQSPIDLVADVPADLPRLDFQYNQPGIMVEINTGHAIQDNVMPGNFLLVLGEKFELKQFHFHSPSEHTVAGEIYPMEVHFVHQNEQGEYLVVGLMFEEGEHNEVMNELPSFRAERGEGPLEKPFDYNELIEVQDEYFMYNGSLTTPPCTEGVQWVVMKRPIIASNKQIQHYYDLLGFDNNRPIQAHNARIVLD